VNGARSLQTLYAYRFGIEISAHRIIGVEVMRFDVPTLCEEAGAFFGGVCMDTFLPRKQLYDGRQFCHLNAPEFCNHIGQFLLLST
jgi:hypothetical protein